ncbi:MAG: hypothetical protein R3Y65_00685 [Bacillota bacterium]
MSQSTAFNLALENLHDIYAYEPPYNNVETLGILKLFCFCFDKSIYAIARYLEKNTSKITPQQLLSQAHECGILPNIQTWQKALSTRIAITKRNLPCNAIDIISDIKNEYYAMFLDLQELIS